MDCRVKQIRSVGPVLTGHCHPAHTSIDSMSGGFIKGPEDQNEGRRSQEGNREVALDEDFFCPSSSSIKIVGRQAQDHEQQLLYNSISNMVANPAAQVHQIMASLNYDSSGADENQPRHQTLSLASDCDDERNRSFGAVQRHKDFCSKGPSQVKMGDHGVYDLPR